MLGIHKNFCITDTFITESFDLREVYNSLNQNIIQKPVETFKTGVPALFYTIQQNLLYIAISNLDAAVYQVTSQIKVLTTAVFMVFLLNKSLRWTQWLSLVILTTGISIIQIQNVTTSNEKK